LRLEQLRRDRAARRERQGKVELALDAGVKSGKLVAALEHVSKSYGDKVVVRDFSCRLQRGDKIGVIGPNGAGKTTLLRMILGELAPDQGKVYLGTKVEVAYFDQFRSALDEEATLIDVISPGSDFVEIGNQRKHVISYLGDFLFAPQRARSLVSSLSGGERNRLLLARLFARPANVLVLDEPTNDLDIETLELLEELLQEYTGTLFLVSHDRAFIDNVVTQTIASEGDGGWREYAGGYQDWADYQAGRLRDEALAASSGKRSDARATETAANAKAAAQKPGGGKLSWKEARELEELPQRISALESEQKAIGERLADAQLYQSQPEEAQRLAARLSEIDDQLVQLLERWEVLEG
jgi:ATP-binding cassette subfamily F protein uup